MNTSFIVMTATAQMPNSCWGHYRRLAVVEVIAGCTPAMISRRARGVVRIIQTYERLNVGKTERSAYAEALVRARALCSKLEVRRINQRFGS